MERNLTLEEVKIKDAIFTNPLCHTLSASKESVVLNLKRSKVSRELDNRLEQS